MEQTKALIIEITSFLDKNLNSDFVFKDLHTVAPYFSNKNQKSDEWCRHESYGGKNTGDLHRISR